MSLAYVISPMAAGWIYFWNPESRYFFFQTAVFLIGVWGTNVKTGWIIPLCNSIQNRCKIAYFMREHKKVVVVKSCDIKIWNTRILQSFCVLKCSCQVHLRLLCIYFSYNFVNRIFVSLNFKGANSSHFCYESINTINLWLQQVLKNKIP